MGLSIVQSRPVQREILEKVGEHARTVGLVPPYGAEPRIYVGRPSSEQCDELHEYGRGSTRTIKFYTLPSGSKLNLHADGNGQHEDAFVLATLGTPAKDGSPVAILLIASPEVWVGSDNPLHTELREFVVRPEGAAFETAMRLAGSIDYKDPLQAVFNRMYVIGPVVKEDAYAPLVESLRRREDIWEPTYLHCAHELSLPQLYSNLCVQVDASRLGLP
eukprot:gene6763-8088_t